MFIPKVPPTLARIPRFGEFKIRPEVAAAPVLPLDASSPTFFSSPTPSLSLSSSERHVYIVLQPVAVNIRLDYLLSRSIERERLRIRQHPRASCSSRFPRFFAARMRRDACRLSFTSLSRLNPRRDFIQWRRARSSLYIHVYVYHVCAHACTYIYTRWLARCTK